MEPIRISSHQKSTALSVIEPINKLELDLLVSFRRLSSDDQRRVLSVLQAMASLHQADCGK